MVHKWHLHSCWYSWTLFPKICSLLSATARCSSFYFPGNFLGRCVTCILGSNFSCCTLAPERQQSVTQARTTCSAIGSVEQLLQRTDHQDNMDKQRTGNTYFKKISVPNECRWISVLPLQGCPRRVFLMLMLINNLVNKQNRKNRKWNQNVALNRGN